MFLLGGLLWDEKALYMTMPGASAARPARWHVKRRTRWEQVSFSGGWTPSRSAKSDGSIFPAPATTAKIPAAWQYARQGPCTAMRRAWWSTMTPNASAAAAAPMPARTVRFLSTGSPDTHRNVTPAAPSGNRAESLPVSVHARLEHSALEILMTLKANCCLPKGT